MIPRYWVGVAAALGVGGILGFIVGKASAIDEARAEEKANFEGLKNAYELALDLRKKNEMAVVGGQIMVPEQEVPLASAMVMMNEPVQNDYHKAIAAVETPIDVFVEGGVNDYGISYIEEEEYLEEDGRNKSKIDIIMDEHQPLFLMDGQQIDDWDQRLGDSILVDFYKLVPPGVDPVLYVRNHRTDEDYEVVRVSP
jgi:hypothetical protein